MAIDVDKLRLFVYFTMYTLQEKQNKSTKIIYITEKEARKA